MDARRNDDQGFGGDRIEVGAEMYRAFDCDDTLSARLDAEMVMFPD